MISGARFLIAGGLALAAFLSCGGVAVGAGPATIVTVVLSPASIPAGGVSTSTVTATVRDVHGVPVAGETNVQVFASDPRITFNPEPAHDNGNGTYTSTLTSSLVAESDVGILAQDGPLFSAPAILTQTAASTTSLAVLTSGPVTSTNLPVTDQGVTLVATVTASPGNVAPSGTVVFENAGSPIAGCAAVPTPTSSSPTVTVTCGTSFAAARSPAQLTAVFAPTAGSLVTASASPAQSVSINRDPTSTSVRLVGSKADVGTTVRFSAQVTPTQQGSPAPAGSVQFMDHGKAIGRCRGQPVGPSSTAVCAVSYRKPGAHEITAAYSGDASFAGSTSGAATVAVQALGTVDATMQWTFYHTPAYTQVRSLIVNGAPPVATIVLKCHGRGCPFARRAIATGGGIRCGPRRRRHRCAFHATIDLTRRFGMQRLRVGAKITIEIVKPRWVGKDYVFTVRARRGPRVQIG